jgi:serine/threonine protein phosphatase 1
MKDKIIIFGHTPTCYMHNKDNCYDIWFDPVFEDKMGIDGGLGPFEDGQLNCICLNTEQTYIIKKSELEDLV